MNLYIESHEGGIYIACVETGQNSKYVCENGRNKCFKSLTEAKEYFGDEHFDNVWLTMPTPYDEMVGLHSTPLETRIPLMW